MIARWLAYTRARQWAHFLPLPLAGLARAHSLRDAAWRAPASIGACAGVLAFGYLLNAVTDRQMDGDPRKNPLLRERARSFAGPLAALALSSLALASTISPLALAAAAAALASGWCYSAGPRWKSVPFAGTALNVAAFAPLMFLGVRDGDDARALAPLALAFAALLLQNQLLHEAADVEEDRRGGLRTTFAVLGPRGSAAAAMLCGLALCAAASTDGASLALALCAPLSLLAPVALLRAENPHAAASARRWHRLASMAAGAALFARFAAGARG